MDLVRASCFSAVFFVYNACAVNDFHYDVHVNLHEKSNFIKLLSRFISKSELMATIENQRLLTEKNKTVRHLRMLKDRIKEAVRAIKQKAHSIGCFNAEVKYDLKQVSPKKMEVKIDIISGDVFELDVDVKCDRVGDFSELQKKIKSRTKVLSASISDMTDLANSAISDLQEIGYFKPELVSQKVTVDYVHKKATLALEINPGVRAVFGESFISFKNIDRKFIKNRIQWNEGELFNINKIRATVENLRSTQIFSKVEIRPVERLYKAGSNEPGIDGSVPIEIELKEDKQHMVDVSILYAGIRNMNFDKTSRVNKDLKSIITRFAWTKFNAFGGGEQLRFAVEGTPMKAQSKRVDYAFEAMLMQPDLLFPKNTANYEVSRRQELTNAFFRKVDKYEVLFSYPIFKNLLLGYGVSLDSSYVDAEQAVLNGDHKRYKSLTFPIELILNRTDDLLNPTSGYRASAKFSEMILQGLKSHLSKAEFGFSYNYPLDKNRKNILAVQLKHKILYNAKLENIPVDRRIFCGGMNSVRGYANQMATEMYNGVVGQEEEILCPAGGKRAFEFSIELRRRFSQNFGGVLFVDGAKTFQNELAKLKMQNKRWFYSFGFGVRYFTMIGPVRFDLAFPIHRRKNIDSKVQFIMSLGQSF